ncbi:MAG: agarase [Pseudomonadota bacterium]
MAASRDLSLGDERDTTAVVFAVGLWTLLVGLSGCGAKQIGDEASDPVPVDDSSVVSEASILEVLADFDTADPSRALDAADAVAVQSTLSGTALELQFTPDANWSVVRLQPASPWDWSDHRDYNFAIDVTNPGPESVQLYVSLSSTPGGAISGNRADTANRSVSVPANTSGTYFFILDGPTSQLNTAKRENPAPWQTDDTMMHWRFGNKSMPLNAVTEIALGVRGNITAKTLQVDNLRLRRNPEHDLSFLAGIVDEFGQNAKVEFPNKVSSLAELKELARSELDELEASSSMADRSRWGGWKDGPRLEATGFFRTEKVDGKWWMVDPDGFLFFSHGLANVRMANLTTFTGIDFGDPGVRYVDPAEVTPEDSMGIVAITEEQRATRFVSSDLRHKMFTWLPSYDDELADHYSFRRSAIMGPLDGGETYSFYRANLERRYGQTSAESYVKAWEQVTLDRMNSWGFTSFGNWVDPAFYPNTQVPYFANGWIIGDFQTLSSPHDVWGSMPDAFDPEFVRRADITISIIADEIQSSPWCVGVFVDNEKSWGYRKGTVVQRYGIILDALSKSAATSAAKAAFVQILEEKYETINDLNRAWQADFESFAALREPFEPATYQEATLSDLSTMLEALSEEYFRVVHGTLERYLPNHLYMGARMANWGMPDETVKASVKYSDVLSFNIYEEGMQPHQWAFLEEVDLPTVIGEFHIGASSDTGLYHPGLVQASDQADRATMYLRYMESVTALDSMVGAHWFQYVDSPLTGRAFDGEGYNVGFVSVTDVPYPEMVEAARAFNSSLYSKRFGPFNQP